MANRSLEVLDRPAVSEQKINENVFPKYPPRYGCQLDSLDDKLRTFLSNVLRSKTLTSAQAIDAWKEENFDLELAINKTSGPIVEVAGPTEGENLLIDFNKVEKNIYVSNIASSRDIIDLETEEFLGRVGRVDFRADATALSIASGKIGVLFASCLPIEAREQFVKESKRVLEIGGILIYQGIRTEDIETAENAGFRLVEYRKQKREKGQIIYDAVFKK